MMDNHFYSIDHIIDSYSENNKRIFFIQVGANDGKKNDPIYRYVVRDNWQGILVEPQKYVFKELVNNYKCCKAYNNLIFENCAIANERGKKTIYKIGFCSSRWATGLTSFSKAVVQKHIDWGYVDKCASIAGISTPEDKQDYIKTEMVNCLTFKDLLIKHKVNKVDIIAIDTEGYDYEIIKMIDLSTLNPSIILFEHRHMKSCDYFTCVRTLITFRYKVLKEQLNTIAYKL